MSNDFDFRNWFMPVFTVLFLGELTSIVTIAFHLAALAYCDLPVTLPPWMLVTNACVGVAWVSMFFLPDRWIYIRKIPPC